MNTKWLCLGLLAMVCTTPAFAARESTHQIDIKICRLSARSIHDMWQHRLFAVPANVSATMVAAMDGQTTEVQAALAKLPAKTMSRWRQLALGMALLGNQSTTVERLLESGASPDNGALMPRLKSDFYRHLENRMTHDPLLGKAVPAFKKAGLLSNSEEQGPPPLFTAIQCNNLAETRLLLQHGADPMRPARPHAPVRRQGTDALIVAAMDGNPVILRLLLGHGAQPCHDDQRLATNWQSEADHRRRKKPPTIAGIAQDAGAPKPLLARLICHQPPPAG